MEDLISILVPVYNVGSWLTYCLESILVQTWENWETILVDDGSTDGSGDVCDSFAAEDSRFRVIHQKNSGVSVSRNAALAAARGKYIYFADADDCMHPRALEYLHAAICSGPYLMASSDFVKVYGRFCWKPDSGQEEIPSRIIKGSDLMWQCVEWYGFIWQVVWSKLIDRSLLEGKTFDAIAQEDRLLMFRLFSEAEEVIHLEYPLYAYLDRPKSLSKEDYYLSMKSNMVILDYMLYYLSDDSKYRSRILRKAFRRYLTLRYHSKGRNEKERLRETSLPFIREHFREHLKSKEIPLWERMLYPVMYACPWTVWIFMKVTGN